MKKIVLAVMFVLLISNPGYSGFKDGNELYKNCSAEDNVQQALCLSYVIGCFDTLETIESKLVCITDGVIANQLGDVVTAYLKTHPEERHYSASSTAIVAMIEAFPCE